MGSEHRNQVALPFISTFRCMYRLIIFLLLSNSLLTACLSRYPQHPEVLYHNPYATPAKMRVPLYIGDAKPADTNYLAVAALGTRKRKAKHYAKQLQQIEIKAQRAGVDAVIGVVKTHKSLTGIGVIYAKTLQANPLLMSIQTFGYNEVTQSLDSVMGTTYSPKGELTERATKTASIPRILYNNPYFMLQDRSDKYWRYERDTYGEAKSRIYSPALGASSYTYTWQYQDSAPYLISKIFVKYPANTAIGTLSDTLVLRYNEAHKISEIAQANSTGTGFYLRKFSYAPNGTMQECRIYLKTEAAEKLLYVEKYNYYTLEELRKWVFLYR